MRKVKILTPLTIGATIIVAALAIMLMMLEPEDLLIWFGVMLFLPAAILGLVIRSKRAGPTEDALRVGGGYRVALVGAGVLLATALGFAVTDNLGLTGAEGQFTGTPIMSALVVAVAVLIDLLGARLEHAATKDPDTDQN